MDKLKLFCFLGLRPRASTYIPVTDLDPTLGPSLKIKLPNIKLTGGPGNLSFCLLKLVHVLVTYYVTV